MPSDPSGRHPIGVLTRPAPDFFDDNIGSGGYAAFNRLAGQDFYMQVSLYNNATTGASLKVYGITVFNDGGGGMVGFQSAGIPSGVQVGPCNPINASLSMPFGLIYQDTEHVPTGNPNPFAIPPVVAYLGGSGFDSFTYLSPFPLFIVPSGFSLSVVDFNSGNILGASFWYQVAVE